MKEATGMAVTSLKGREEWNGKQVEISRGRIHVTGPDSKFREGYGSF